MIGDRLEARLRLDPDGDPRHEVGRVWTRVAGSTLPAARPVLVRAMPAGALVAIIALLLAGLILRPRVQEPGATPSPTVPASPTVPPSNAAAVSAIYNTWAQRLGPANRPPASITIIARTGNDLNVSAGTFPIDQPFLATARIGEIGRVYIAAAIVRLAACSTDTKLTGCNGLVNDRGFSLDSTVKSAYPPWNSDVAFTTIGNVLEGTSGFAPIASSLDELAAQIAADPGADWSRATRLNAAMSNTRRFAPGDRREPADTEWILLEEMLGYATGRPVDDVMLGGDVVPPLTTAFADQPPNALISGSLATGEAVSDLDPALLALVGNEGGMSASSHDLAELAVSAWGTAAVLDTPMVDELIDAPDHANPLGATAICCGDLPANDIGATGHAVGWSSAVAWAFDSQIAVGVVIGRDVREDDLQALLHELIAVPSP